MKLLSTILRSISVTLAILSTCAYGAYNTYPQTDTNPNKYYVELNAGVNAWYLGIFTSANTNLSNAGINGYGWQAIIGYNFNPTRSIEAGFMQNYFVSQDIYEELDCQAGRCTTIITKKDKTYNIYVPTVAVKFTVPMGERFDFISKVGLMVPLATIDTTYKNNGKKSSETTGIILPYISLGFDYNVSDNVKVNIQYQGAIYGVAGLGLLSAGVGYSFS